MGGNPIATGVLSPVTENSKTGVRLSTTVAANYGDIGSEAVDLSYSSIASSTVGATGDYSISMGYRTTASGDNSTSMGDNTTASGDNSTAIGEETIASDFASATIGRYNLVNSTVTTGGSATAFDTDNAAFVIGNGLYNAPSDAFVVKFNGDATLQNDLEVGGDLDVTGGLTVGGSPVGTGVLSPVTENSKTGVRLSTTVAANYGDIGSEAVDLSYSSIASSTVGATGDYSISMGYRTTASGDNSTFNGGQYNRLW